MSRSKVLVAGGSRGIGRACCERFAREGANVAFLYRSDDTAAAETCGLIEAAGGQANAIQADIVDAQVARDAVLRAANSLGGIDVLIHCAGMLVNWIPVRAHEVSAWDAFIRNDLLGAFHVIHPTVQLMHEQRAGNIIAVSSIAAQMCQPRNSQGAVAKAGLEALVRVLAKEEGRHGLRVNAVSVGLTDTNMAKDAADSWGEEFIEKLVAGFPIPRIGRPEEIAEMIHFIACEKGAYITGKVFQVDGGQHISG